MILKSVLILYFTVSFIFGARPNAIKDIRGNSCPDQYKKPEPSLEQVMAVQQSEPGIPHDEVSKDEFKQDLEREIAELDMAI